MSANTPSAGSPKHQLPCWVAWSLVWGAIACASTMHASSESTCGYLTEHPGVERAVYRIRSDTRSYPVLSSHSVPPPNSRYGGAHICACAARMWLSLSTSIAWIVTVLSAASSCSRAARGTRYALKECNTRLQIPRTFCKSRSPPSRHTVAHWCGTVQERQQARAAALIHTRRH